MTPALAVLLLAIAAPGPAPAPAAAETGAAASSSEVDSAALEESRNAEVVTARGTVEAQSQASANVLAIGWEEIARRRYGSLAEILSDVPGLYVVDDLVTPAISVRGVSGGLRAGTRIVKVMINGVPVNFRPDLTAFLGPEYIPVEMIERVEVAKGPLSALHGANAFLATVNVITRGQGGAQLIAEASARGYARGGGLGFGGTLVGGFNEGGQSLLVATTAQRFDRSGLGVERTFPGQDPELSRYRPFFGKASEGDLATPTGFFAQHTTRSEALGTLSLQGGIQRLDSMGEFQLNSVLTHQSRYSLENQWLSVRHERRWSETAATSVWLGWAHGAPTRDEELHLTGVRDSVFSRHLWYRAFDGAAELALSFGSLQLKGGVDASYEPQGALFYSQTFLGGGGGRQAGEQVDLVGEDDARTVTLFNVAAYLQAAIEPLEGLHLVGDARVDVPNLYPAQPSWRLSLVRRWSDAFTTKLFGGRAFQTPSATLLNGLTGFGSANNVIGSRTQSASHELVPQSVDSVEAMASALLFGRLAIDLSLWGQQIDDPIEFVQVGANFQARNQDVQRGFGAEGRIRLELGRLSAQLFAEGMRALEGWTVKAEPPSSFPSYRFGGGLNASFPEAHFNLNLNGVRVGPRGATQSNAYLNDDTPYSLPAYTTVDATLATLGLHFLGGAQTSLSLSCRNLLGERRSEPGFGGLDVPSLGRVFVGELRQAF